MKRVICFDLWGTLVCSSVRRTYEDVLAEYWPRKVIQETVRDLLMTETWIQHPLSEHNGQGTLRPNHLRMAAMLLTRLWKISPPMSQVYWSDSHNWGAFDKTMTEFSELLMETAKYWQMENDLVKWIPGALEVVESLKVHGNRLALVTNTTSCGDATVDIKLNMDRPSGRFFSAVFNSCAHPFAKPDRRVWEYLTECFADMDEYWMIGNDPVIDIAVPSAMGWKTILVNHPNGVSITEVPKIIEEGK